MKILNDDKVFGDTPVSDEKPQAGGASSSVPALNTQAADHKESEDHQA